MDDNARSLQEDILRLYQEPIIGASYSNPYGEENIKNLVEKYRGLNAEEMQAMRGYLVDYSQSPDLTSCYLSVGTLYALGLAEDVRAAYRWASGLEEASLFLSHFDIGKSLADHFINDG